MSKSTTRKTKRTTARSTTKRTTTTKRRIKVTSEVAELLVINDIITKNKKLFKTGSIIPRKTLVKLFSIKDVTKGTYPVLQRANLVLVGLQAKINKLMRENGLYLRSRNYYTEFEVLDKPCTKEVTIETSLMVDAKALAASRLEAGLTTRVGKGNWGTYNKVPPTFIRNNMKLVPSTRHKNTTIRVVQI